MGDVLIGNCRKDGRPAAGEWGRGHHRFLVIVLLFK